MPFIGPHTAATQAHAAHIISLTGGNWLQACDVAAEMTVRAVLSGKDPMPEAMIYDACEREFAAEIASVTASLATS